MSRRGRTVLALLLSPFVLVVALFLGNVYARQRVAERLAYWRAETAPLVSQAADVAAVRAFAARHGITPYCNPAASECSGRDPVEFGVLPTWHVRLTFKLNQGRVVAATATPLGVGL